MKYYFLGDSSLTADVCRQFGGKAQKLHELLLAGFPVPAGLVLLENNLVDSVAIERIGGFPVAVRSSGALEDLDNASFAGLYETFLFVNSPEELQQSIQKCFESLHSERVKGYLEQKGIDWTPESLKMSVIVQKMVDAQVAGVLFTLNPLNGREEEIYLEFCEGVGERLVSGHVTPSRLTFNWQQEQTVLVDVNTEGTRLGQEHLHELAGESLRIQAHYGHPQDIEWGIDKNGKLFILQSRPVTSYQVREDRPELTNADFKDGGVSARVCTPMMFSLYRDALKFSMGNYFKQIKLITNDDHIEWIYYAYGRVYWNAEAVKSGLKAIPDFKEEEFDRDLGIQKNYGTKGPHHTPVNLSTIVGAIPILLALHKEYQDCLNMISLFRVRFEEQDQRLKEHLSKRTSLTSSEFSTLLLQIILFQQETEKNYFRTIYNNSNFQSEFRGLVKKNPEYQAGDEIDLMGELHGVQHLDVQSGLAELAKVADLYGFFSQSYHSAREKFLKHHYHHGPAELDITVPRWGEKKEWVDELVRNFHPSSNISARKFEETRERLASSLGFMRRGKFLRTLERSRQFLRAREEMRSYSTRAYYLLRMGILEFARREGLGEDVFMLDIQEIREKLLNYSVLLPDISARKLFYHGYSKFRAPNEFGGTIQALKSFQGGLKGLGCSPGEFVGTARVILDIHQTGSLTKEDILITAFTDPGWTPVLARVGGVVTEVGGLLSHAAVIGREYGIPAILNLIDATRLIKNGDRIKINGKTGVVEILEKSP